MFSLSLSTSRRLLFGICRENFWQPQFTYERPLEFNNLANSLTAGKILSEIWEETCHVLFSSEDFEGKRDLDSWLPPPGKLWGLPTFSLRHACLRMHSPGSSGLREHVEYWWPCLHRPHVCCLSVTQCSQAVTGPSQLEARTPWIS